MRAPPVVQGPTPCPPNVMVLARELSEANEAVFDADVADRVALAAADQRFHAAQDALDAAGWYLGGPTRNVPGGALSWVLEPA